MPWTFTQDWPPSRTCFVGPEHARHGGLRCLCELIKMNPEVMVIAASGYSAGGAPEQVMKAGAAGFLGKPFSFTELLSLVREQFDTPG